MTAAGVEGASCRACAMQTRGMTPSPVQVNNLLLEFLHKYVAEVVTDATSFQEHANKPELDTDDVRWGGIKPWTQ